MAELKMVYTDIHFHLDGSINIQNAKKLAKLQNIKLDSEDDEELKKIFTSGQTPSLEAFLKCFLPASKLLQTKESISEAIYLLQEDFKKLGGIYLEIRFAPMFHCFQGLTQEEVVLAAIEGVKRSDLDCNLILCLMRRELTEQNIAKNKETLRLAKKYIRKGIAGIDIAGDELHNPILRYKELFEEARQAGIPFTIHAGESDGPESISNAIDLGARRIGHGIRCYQSEEIMEKILKNNIYLEICPLSNIGTNSIKREELPKIIKKILDKGIKVTFNTDDMGILGTDITNDYEFLIKEVGLTREQCIQFVYNAIDCSFAPEEVKNKLREKVKKCC